MLNEQVVSLKKLVKELKKITVFVSNEHCTAGMFTRMFNLFEYLFEDLDETGIVRFLDTNAYNNFDVIHEKAKQRKLYGEQVE